MKFKAIIFDMDGTISDTEKIWNQATRNLITKKGINLDENLYNELSNQIRGLALPKSCQIIKDATKIEDSLNDLIVQQACLAQELYNSELQFIEGFVDFHRKLTKLNLKKSIATNADDETLKLTKSILNLEKYFGEHIYNISQVNNKSKPDPDIYLFAAGKLNIKPEECVAIEDSFHGIRAAKKANMFCIGINSAKNRELLKESDLIIDHYDEINLEDILEISK